MGQVLMKKRSALAVNVRLTHGEGTAERKAALKMLPSKAVGMQITVGADKAYDHAAFVDGFCKLKIVPRMAPNYTSRSSRTRGYTLQHKDYGLIHVARNLIVTFFGDGKQHETLREVKARGPERVEGVFILSIAATNLGQMIWSVAGPSLVATEKVRAVLEQRGASKHE